MPKTQRLFHAGLYVYAFGSFAAGIFDLIWGNFDAAHQPIQAWGNSIPGITVFAYITGVWMVLGAVMLLWRRSQRTGGVLLAVVYFVFALFWLPRFHSVTHYLGATVPVYIGVFSGVGTELMAFAAGVLIWASLDARELSSSSVAVTAMRWIFGICAIAFGLAQLTDVKDSLMFVPKWLPPGAEFWVIFTGVCFVLSGLAILSGILDVLAAWLLGLMFLVFNVTILPSFIFANPKNHAAWGGNAYNLAAVGSSWILAAAIARRRDTASEPRLVKP